MPELQTQNNTNPMTNRKKKSLTISESKRLDKPFDITSVCRADLTHPMIGYSQSKALRVTDAKMERIASKLADDYTEQLFWASLEIICEFVLDDK